MGRFFVCFVLAGEAIRIGISLPTQREEIWVHHKNNMEKAAKALGAEVLVQISDNDAAKRQSQCENLLAQDIDVPVVGAQDAISAGNIVDLAHAMEAPVVSYDHLILNSERWRKWMVGDAVNHSVERILADAALTHRVLEISGHYVFNDGGVKTEMEVMFRKLASAGLDPHRILVNAIAKSIERYVDGFNLEGITSKVLSICGGMP